MKMANVKRMMMYSVNDTEIVRKSLEIGVLPIGLEPCTCSTAEQRRQARQTRQDKACDY